MIAAVNLSNISNEDLAAECARRPVVEEAWQEFWFRFYPLVYRKVMRLLSPYTSKRIRSELDDIVQLVFLRIFQRLPNYNRQKSPFTAYLSLVTFSTVMDELRRNKTKEPVALEEFHEFADELSTGKIEAEELWQTVVKVLQGQEPRDRVILEELLNGEPRQEIGVKHGITVSHVYTITYRFRRALREALNKRT
jgi:RNA polymerase sigma factor (sigma-70 family)